MRKKSIEKYTLCTLLLFVCTIFTACIGEENCDDRSATAWVEDLIKLLPKKEEYEQGEVVNLKIEIPSINTYLGRKVVFYSETNDASALLAMGANELFLDNELTFIRGRQGKYENWFYLLYNKEKKVYELELLIRLKKSGIYSFVDTGSIYFIGEDCNRFVIDTNVLWAGDALIEFTVNEQVVQIIDKNYPVVFAAGRFFALRFS